MRFTIGNMDSYKTFPNASDWQIQYNRVLICSRHITSEMSMSQIREYDAECGKKSFFSVQK